MLCLRQTHAKAFLSWPTNFLFSRFIQKEEQNYPKREISTIFYSLPKKIIFPFDKSNTTIKLGVQKTFLGRKRWQLYSKRLYHGFEASQKKIENLKIGFCNELFCEVKNEFLRGSKYLPKGYRMQKDQSSYVQVCYKIVWKKGVTTIAIFFLFPPLQKHCCCFRCFYLRRPHFI